MLNNTLQIFYMKKITYLKDFLTSKGDIFLPQSFEHYFRETCTVV